MSKQSGTKCESHSTTWLFDSGDESRKSGLARTWRGNMQVQSVHNAQLAHYCERMKGGDGYKLHQECDADLKRMNQTFMDAPSTFFHFPFVETYSSIFASYRCGVFNSGSPPSCALCFYFALQQCASRMTMTTPSCWLREMDGLCQPHQLSIYPGCAIFRTDCLHELIPWDLEERPIFQRMWYQEAGKQG